MIFRYLIVSCFVLISAGFVAFAKAEVRFERIVLPPNPSAEVQLAVDDLLEVLALLQSDTPRVLSWSWRYTEDTIFIGDRLLSRWSLPRPRDLPVHTGWLGVRDGNRVLLRGSDERGLLHAVYHFMDSTLGARMYYPDADLELVDRCSLADRLVELLDAPKAVAPYFKSRNVRGIDRIDGGRFSRFNRLGNPIPMDHALADLFDAELFSQRPELFATRNGRQTPPKGSNQTDPQPHLALEATADWAAGKVLQYFRENPAAAYFSLGTNDNVLFDDTELTREIIEPLSWFREMPNFSNLVFLFMNRIAERVFDEGGAWYNQQGQPRYLTALAYYWSEAVPDFAVHPRVMPVLTADRAQWHDPDYRLEDKELIQAWGRSGAERIATWDYYMGPPLPYPRQYVSIVSDSIRHLAANNCDAFYTAMPYVLAFHGPKAYFLARLLWAPDADEAAVLDEFYSQVFGPAADTMRLFYERFEQERSLREGTGKWIKFFKDEACIEIFPKPFLQEMAAVLDKAAAEANEDEAVLQRIESIQRDFELTLRYSEFQQARRELVEMLSGVEPESGGEQTAAIIINALLDYQHTSQLLDQKLHTLFKIPNYRRNFAWMLPFGSRQSNPTMAALGGLLQTSSGRDLLKQHPDLIAEHNLAGFLSPQEHAQTNSGSGIQNPLLLHNPDAQVSRYLFPEDMPQVPGWLIDLRPAEFLRVSAAQDAPGMGIRIAGSDATSAITQAWVEGGGHYLLETEFEAQVSPDNRTRLEVIWVDADNRVIKAENVLQVPVSGWDETTDPARSYTFNLQIPLIAPENAKLLRVRFSTSRQYPGDFLEIRWVERRKVEGERLKAKGETASPLV